MDDFLKSLTDTSGLKEILDYKNNPKKPRIFLKKFLLVSVWSATTVVTYNWFW
ncbi:MAG: hypothetical protein Q7K34_03525 [archaeon]|nr:hypothetical protein [archaeon]